MTRLLCFVALLCLVATASLYAETGRSSQPIKIKSNELSTDSNKRTAVFSGNVSARQGDLTIYSDRLIISYSADSQAVEQAEAIGNVRIIQGDRQAFSGHAVYDNKGGKIVLDDSPRVVQGDDVVTGKVITYFLDDRKSIVTGGEGVRVNAIIHPGNKGKDGGN